jgi:hypothetical protein
MPISADDPMAAVRAASAERRSARTELRRDLRNGTVTLQQAMADPPPELEKVLLVDVLRMVRSKRSRSSASMAVLGRRAVHDGVNLMLPVGKASAWTREWVAEHGMLGVHAARFTR